MSEAQDSKKKLPGFDLMRMAGLSPKPRDKKYATFNARMLAATIDSTLLTFLVGWFFERFYGPVPVDLLGLRAQMATMDPQAASELFLRVVRGSGFIAWWRDNLATQISVYCLFSAVCWHFWAATPGKMLLRMKLVDAKTEQPISDLQILLRISGYAVSGMCFLIGFFWIGMNKRKQGWHDLLAGTVVINVPKSASQAANPSDSQAPSTPA